MRAFRSAIGSLPWLVLTVSRFANADCECGYSVNKTSDAHFGLFTELQENDFLHHKGDNVTKFGWRPQEFNVSKGDSTNPYGKDFELHNLELNPLKDAQSWSGESENGGDAGLKLWVRGDHSHGYVSSAELASVRSDVLYGSVRVGMKLGQTGTCGAFFYFFNNSQEIDMEFLSREFNNSQGAVNLVLQSPETAITHDAVNSSTYHVQHLDFRPDRGFHEYRFDWTPNRVAFFIDGEFVYDMTENIPSVGGHLQMNHWSNGNPLWSGGPPNEDTPMTISYVKAYFNSSETAPHETYKERCPTLDPAKVCQIPDQSKAPNGNDAKTYFFSQDGPGKTPGQETFTLTSKASNSLAPSLPLSISVIVALFGWALL
ncbi:unnamed protein product [Periconia digitata]|uniref:GH16 domain-containing protein n=1 Tax=Periconia digitata TaxID=1303443 RepID=A0A9W4U7Q6_9PLEO|nr:unnamed protein product [Periconia digitata]